MLARSLRFLVLLVSRPRVEHLEHPHGALAFAGQRTALLVRATGHGILGVGALAREVRGGFAGVLFVDVPDTPGRVALTVPIRSVLFRHTRTVLLDVLPGPPVAPAPPAPRPVPSIALKPCLPALPSFEVDLEVPRP